MHWPEKRQQAQKTHTNTAFGTTSSHSQTTINIEISVEWKILSVSLSALQIALSVQYVQPCHMTWLVIIVM